MRVLVCGDRNWTDREKIRLALEKLERGTIIIHGGCRGADLLANEVALALNHQVVTCKANWADQGRAAGPIRNRKMLDLKPELVLAFHQDLTKSKGTKDCVEEARRRGIAVMVVG